MIKIKTVFTEKHFEDFLWSLEGAKDWSILCSLPLALSQTLILNQPFPKDNDCYMKNTLFLTMLASVLVKPCRLWNRCAVCSKVMQRTLIPHFTRFQNKLPGCWHFLNTNSPQGLDQVINKLQGSRAL